MLKVNIICFIYCVSCNVYKCKKKLKIILRMILYLFLDKVKILKMKLLWFLG